MRSEPPERAVAAPVAVQPEMDGGATRAEGRARVQEIVAHLPEQVAHDIVRWYDRLSEAKCVKVTMDTDETWTNLWDLDERGVPRLVHRERFQMHQWMTPDLTWLVIYPYKDDAPDTSDPHVQLLWIRAEGAAWERIWMPDQRAYRARKYECREPYGPVDCEFYSRGCLHGGVLESWIAPGIETLAPGHPIHTNGFLRHPNLAQVPPDADAQGVWLDVFKEVSPRDEEAEPESFYRRQDFMLLARNEQGEPELRDWRTRVVTDSREGGMKPTEIAAVSRHQKYLFASEFPPDVEASMREFRALVDRERRTEDRTPDQ